MPHSTVKWFDNEKGYGFLHHPEDGEDIFVHYSNIVSDEDFKTLQADQHVRFELNDGPKGLHALEVEATDTEASDDDEVSADSDDFDIDPSAIDPTAEVDPTPKD